MKLTEKGKELFEYLNNATELINLGEKMILDKNSIENGEITIACPSHIATYYLMDRMEKARIDYPNLHIKLISNPDLSEIIKMLKEHKVDFVITDILPENNDNIVIEELKEISNIFVSKDKINIKELKQLENYKYITNLKEKNTAKKLIELLKKYEIKIEPIMEFDTTELRVNAVKRNMGIAYVMKESVKKELEMQELYEVKLPITLPTIKINLIYFKGYLTKVDKEFIKQYLKQ